MYKTINTKNIQLNIVTNCYKKYIKNKRYPSNKYKKINNTMVINKSASGVSKIVHLTATCKKTKQFSSMFVVDKIYSTCILFISKYNMQATFLTILQS